jgi:pyruvate decarboxylase
MKAAEYLFARLRQLGVGSVHGVPGDYNLTLLDYVEPSGLQWVGNANELNAAYAADGYARIKGISAVITTFGVGELSAINAIAGAYTERAPVVHIVGIPPRASHEDRLLIHHTFNDGEYNRFAAMHAHVTVAQTRLWDPRTAPEQIDEALRQCLIHSRPVYIEVPVDLVAATVRQDRLSKPLEPLHLEPNAEATEALEQILSKMKQAKKPYIMVDGETRPMGVIDEVQSIMRSTNWPTFSAPFGKGLVDETVSNFHGIYRGSFDEPDTKSFIEGCDLALNFGPHLSSINTYAYSSICKPDITIAFKDTQVQIGNKVFRDVPAKYIIARIAEAVANTTDIERYESYPALPRDYKLNFSQVSAEKNIAQDQAWKLLANVIRPGDIILGETGTAAYGVREMPLQPYNRLFTAVTWLSIGYMLPAAQGVALAQRELIQQSEYHGLNDARTILLIGDGSFQMTAQELATIIRLNLNVIVFLINNDGYTIERCIHGRKQGYNDVTPWRYLKAPEFFGAEEGTYTAVASTYGQLEKILSDDKFVNGTGLRMVEIMMERDDVPKGPLLHLMNTQVAGENPR